jgi:hypothetical protein
VRATTPDPEAWRSTAEILEANERAWADLFVEGGE